MADTDLLSRALDHHKSGRLEDAKALYLRILDENPDDPDALNYLGVFECQLRRFDQAEELINRSLRINPDNTKAHNNLGNVLRYQGRFDQAEAAFRRAYELDPDNAEAHFNCGTVMLEQGKAQEAAERIREAVALAPEDPRARGLVSSVALLDELGIEDKRLGDDLIHVSAFDGIDTSPLRRIASVLIVQQPEIEALITPEGRALNADQLSAVIKNRLLTRCMAKDFLVHTALEKLLTGVRRQCLEGLLDGTLTEVGGEARSEFLAALANQCFLNEYVFTETPEEKKSAGHLEENIAAAIDAGTAPDAQAIFVLAAYRPLAGTSFGQTLARPEVHQGYPLLSAIVQRQVIEPLMERELAPSLARLTPVEDSVSKDVRQQYEENPYPRWQHLDTREPLPLGLLMKRRFPFLGIEEADYPANPGILVAGSGTGREPVMHAREYQGSSVLAVDLSLASLAYGARMASKMGVDNIEFAQADILELGALDRRFDVIYSSGVLHHMADPVAGWRVLTGLLTERGVMYIGLYSEHARQSVAAARDFIAAGGYPPTAEGIRRCRADIMALPATDPVAGVMNTADFYAMSPCRDLIFHVQEHRFSVPAIAEALKALELRFLGFETRSSVLARYRKQYPDDGALTDLGNWSRMESADPSLFSEMYQFWVTKAQAGVTPDGNRTGR
ncbi:MAG: tetratricopeptide repeat protein [Proteobacteria bacterium]|nr:tetratricopeptide repeat protein [Pseudomonadota bacterium]